MQMDVELFDMRMLHLTESYTRTFDQAAAPANSHSAWKRAAHMRNTRSRESESHAFPEVERALVPDTAPSAKPLEAT